MKIYRLHKKQNLPITVDEAWEFLSSPKNLKTITPEYMGFQILSGAEKPMYPGYSDTEADDVRLKCYYDTVMFYNILIVFN